ncbi:MAG: extracellular solute-binding protein, partial [Spirochaetales bacterium]|nr:extracellular solute-binding protein [Spirochaetales bacterium]
IILFSIQQSNLFFVKNSAYNKVIHGIESIAHKEGYSVILLKLVENNILPDIIKNKGVSGVILLGGNIPESIATLLSLHGIKFVSIDRETRETKYFSIETDYHEGIQKSIDYLIKLEHQKFAFLSGNLKKLKFKEKYNAFRQAIKENKLKYYPEFEKIQSNGEDEIDFGIRAIEEIVKEKDLPTAIIASNNRIAYGAISALQHNGISVPLEISVIGFDEGMEEYFNNKLTSATPDWSNKGKIAATILLQLIEGFNISPYKSLVKNKIIKGETCSKNKKSSIRKRILKVLTYWFGSEWQMYNHEKEVILKWNNNNPEYHIAFNPIPEGLETELIIKNSIIRGKSPDIVQGVEIFFANNLAFNGFLVALDTLEGFNSTIKKRGMEIFLDKLRAQDGHIYVFPQHWTPVLGIYNKKLLEKAGFTKPPISYSEFNDFAEYLISLKKVKALDAIPISNWWHVAKYWNNFRMSALGKNGINIDIYRIDTPENREFFKFIEHAVKSGYVSTNNKEFNFINKGNIGFRACIDFIEFRRYRELNPNLKYILSNPPIPDFISHSTTRWADASVKGAVIFKNSRDIEGAWSFLKWYFSEIENDLNLLKVTSHLPCRGNLKINPYFNDYFGENPQIIEFINFLDKSYTITHKDKIEVFSIINEKLWEPLILKNIDWEKALEKVNDYLKEMEKSI